MEELKKSIAELAAKTSLDPRILTDIVQKSLSASEWGKGRTFVICLKDGPEPKLEGHYKNVGSIEGANDLKARKIYDFEAIAYLNIVEGDGAVVIAADGQTLAVNAKLASDPKTQVDPIPGAGSRHLSAQKTTKESNTVAVVVSEDGPVTIFYQGGVVFRKT